MKPNNLPFELTRYDGRTEEQVYLTPDGLTEFYRLIQAMITPKQTELEDLF